MFSLNHSPTKGFFCINHQDFQSETDHTKVIWWYIVLYEDQNFIMQCKLNYIFSSTNILGRGMRSVNQVFSEIMNIISQLVFYPY